MSTNEVNRAIPSESEDADALPDLHPSKGTECERNGDPPDDWKSRFPFMNRKAADLVREVKCAKDAALEPQQSAKDGSSAAQTESSGSSESTTRKSKMPGQHRQDELHENPNDVSSVSVGDKLPRLVAEREEEPDPADLKSAGTATDVHRSTGDDAKDFDERSAADAIAVKCNTCKEEPLTRPSSPTPPAHTDDDVSVSSANYAASESDNPTDTASFYSARTPTECSTNVPLSKDLKVLSPAKEALKLCHNDSSDAENLTDGEHTVLAPKDYAESMKKRSKLHPRFGSVEFHICDSSSTSPTTSGDDSKSDVSQLNAPITATNEGGQPSRPRLEQHQSTTSFTKRKATFEALTTPVKSSATNDLTVTLPDSKTSPTAVDGDVRSELGLKRSEGQAAVDREPRMEDRDNDRGSNTDFKRDQADNKLVVSENTSKPANTAPAHSDTCEEERCASSVDYSSSSVSLNSCMHAKGPPASLDESDAASDHGGSLHKALVAKTIDKRKKRVARRSSSLKPVAITTLPSEPGQVYEFKAQSGQVAGAVSDGGTTHTKPQPLDTKMTKATSLASLAGAAVRRAGVHAFASNESNSRSKPVAKKNEPAKPASERDQLRDVASGKAGTSVMDSAEDDSVSKKSDRDKAEDASTKPAREPEGMKRSTAKKSSWSLFQFKQKQAMVVVTPSADQQLHSEASEGTRLGGPTPTVAHVSPTVLAKAAPHDADSQPRGSNDVDLPSKASAKKSDPILRIIKDSQAGTVDIRKPASLEDKCNAVKAGLLVADDKSKPEATEPTEVPEPSLEKQSLPLIPTKNEQVIDGTSQGGSKLAVMQLPPKVTTKPAAPKAGSLTTDIGKGDSLSKPSVQVDRSVKGSEPHGHGDTSNTETIASDAMEGSVPPTPGKDTAGEDASLFAFQKPEAGSKKKRAARRESKNKSDWSLLLPDKATVANQQTVGNTESSQTEAADPVKSIPAATKQTSIDPYMALAKLTARNASLQIGDNADMNSPPVKRRAKGHNQAASESAQNASSGVSSSEKVVPGETEGRAVPKAARSEISLTGSDSKNKITKFSGRCHTCFEKGHKSLVCPKPKNVAEPKSQPKPSLSRSSSNASSNDKRTDANTCWGCHKAGHVLRNCQEPLSDEGSGSDGEVVTPLCKDHGAGNAQLPRKEGDKETDHPFDNTNDGKCPAGGHEEKAVDTAASLENVDAERQVQGEHADDDPSRRRNTVRSCKARSDVMRPARGGSLANGLSRYYRELITQQQQEAKAEPSNSTRAQETLKELFRQSTRAQSAQQDEPWVGTDVDAVDELEAQPLKVGTSASSDQTADSMDGQWKKQVACPMQYAVTGPTVEPAENWSAAVFDRRLRKNIVVHLGCAEPDSLQSLFAPTCPSRQRHSMISGTHAESGDFPPARRGQTPAQHEAVACCHRRRRESHSACPSALHDTQQVQGDPSRGEGAVARFLTFDDLETALKARHSHSGNALSVHDKKTYRGCHLLSCNISRFMALTDIGVTKCTYLMGRDEDFFAAYLMGLLQSQELPSVDDRLTFFIAQPNAGELVEQAACMALKRNHAAIHDL